MPRALSPSEIESFRHDLCDVATQLFTARGFDGVTMRAIAGELGVSPMTPYGYFESKADIYGTIRRQAFERFGAQVAAAAEAEPDPLGRLHALFKAYLRFALDEPGAYRIMFELSAPEAAEPDPEDGAASAATWIPLLQTLEDAVAQGCLEGDPLTLAHLCWLQVHGLASLHLSGRLRFGRSFDELLEPAFDSLLHGFLARPRESTADEAAPAPS